MKKLLFVTLIVLGMVGCGKKKNEPTPATPGGPNGTGNPEITQAGNPDIKSGMIAFTFRFQASMVNSNGDGAFPLYFSAVITETASGQIVDKIDSIGPGNTIVKMNQIKDIVVKYKLDFKKAYTVTTTAWPYYYANYNSGQYIGNKVTVNTFNLASDALKGSCPGNVVYDDQGNIKDEGKDKCVQYPVFYLSYTYH